MIGLLILLATNRTFASLPQPKSVTELSLCTHGFVETCMTLAKESEKNARRTFQSTEPRRETKITIADYEREVKAVLGKVKERKDSKIPCGPTIVLSTMSADKNSVYTLCAQDYSQKEWASWSQFLR